MVKIPSYITFDKLSSIDIASLQIILNNSYFHTPIHCVWRHQIMIKVNNNFVSISHTPEM